MTKRLDHYVSEHDVLSTYLQRAGEAKSSLAADKTLRGQVLSMQEVDFCCINIFKVKFYGSNVLQPDKIGGSRI